MVRGSDDRTVRTGYLLTVKGASDIMHFYKRLD
jgi:hypothetical protein